MKDVKPYFVPPAESVVAAGWERLVDDGWVALEDWIESWDYRTVLRVRSHIEVDMGAVRGATGLRDGTPLVWTVGWRADDSKLVSEPSRIPVVHGRNEFEFEVRSDRAGASIVLTRRMTLGRNRMNAGVGQPRWAGSILWADETRVRLTGHGAAFPTEVVDFRALGRDPRASWYLELPLSPDVAAMGSFLLLINSADSALVAAVSTGRRSSDSHRLLGDTMFEGVVEEIVRWALGRWTDLRDCDEDSAGASARILTARVLPEPERWTGPDIDSMALKAAVTAGARGMGFGRRLA